MAFQIPQARRVSLDELRRQQYIQFLHEQVRRDETGYYTTTEERVQDALLRRDTHRFADKELIALTWQGRGWEVRHACAVIEDRATEADWQAIWRVEHRHFEDDYRAYLKSLETDSAATEPDTIIELGIVEASTLRRLLIDLKGDAYHYPPPRNSSFRQFHLIHACTEDRHLAWYVKDDEPERIFVAQAEPGLGFSIGLQWLTNTSAYPSILDIEKRNQVALAVNATTKHLIVRGTAARWTARLPLMVLEVA